MVLWPPLAVCSMALAILIVIKFVLIINLNFLFVATSSHYSLFWPWWLIRIIGPWPPSITLYVFGTEMGVGQKMWYQISQCPDCLEKTYILETSVWPLGRIKAMSKTWKNILSLQKLSFSRVVMQVEEIIAISKKRSILLNWPQVLVNQCSSPLTQLER